MGLAPAPGKFCLRQGVGQEAGSGKRVWPEFAGAIFVSVFDSLWFLFVFFFVLFLCVCLAVCVFFVLFAVLLFCDCVS